ncbi:uncharacterized protein [Dysidea avara]|uniref:uncharacterized protein isoform X2 n=1 Tax=Dysidea avara TaxID=196820 RepID=UPI003327CFD7
MLSLCQKVAVQSSTVGILQFREMYSTVETLLHKWDSGSKCVIVSCDDEDQPTQEKPVQVDEFDVILDESPVQYEVVTLHEQELEEEETTAINCSNEEEETTVINCSNEEEETTIKEELTFEAVKMEQLTTPSATPLPVKKTSIHLKPSTKICGRPKYSSKYWPSKAKKKRTINTDDLQTQTNDARDPVVARKRSRRCGDCVGCKSENCEKCSACLDMTKYGGSGKKKQCCVNRRCTGQHTASIHCTESTNIWVDLDKSSWWTLKPEIKDVVYDIWQEAQQGIFGKMGLSDMMDVDIFALFSGNWLTDKTITTFLKVAAIYSSELNGKKAFVASSFLYNSMCRDLDLAKKWYRNVNICDYSLWVVPVNINQSHWILVVVHPVKKELWLYDSVANTHPNCVALLEWLVAKTGVTWKDIRALSQYPDMPLQTNSCDCGIFVCVGNTNEIREWMTWKIAEYCLPGSV